MHNTMCTTQVQLDVTDPRDNMTFALGETNKYSAMKTMF